MWRPIPNTNEWYEVSDCGQVRSVDRQISISPTKYWPNGRTLNMKGKLLKLTQGKHYLYTSLGASSGKVYVHDIVTRTFLGPKPDGYDVDHKNKNKLDNRLTNLQYLPIKENRGRIGEKHNLTKLTNKDVLWIRKHCIPRHSTLGVKPLAIKFNVAPEVIYCIVNRKTWKNL